MGEALQKHCGEVHYIGPIKTTREFCAKVFNRLTVFLLGKRFGYMQSFFVAKKYAEIARKRIAIVQPDLIFAPAASAEIALLETGLPIVYCSDATFSSAQNYNPFFSNLLKVSVQEGMKIENLALQKASLVLYPTAWAAKSASDDYKIALQKIHIIPYGANLEGLPDKETALNRKKTGKCRLLFLGVNWQWKGGEIAFETLLELEKMGLDAELVVCGCRPPKPFRHERMVVIPFLNKNNTAERQKIFDLFLASDFLLLPTRTEAFGIVFCEANAFGLPAIATDTGGVSGVIENGKNGFLLPMEARGAEYARLIYQIYQDDRRYDALVLSSRATFEERLNWDAWGKSVKKLIEHIL